jgi:hypothetical protein
MLFRKRLSQLVRMKVYSSFSCLMEEQFIFLLLQFIICPDKCFLRKMIFLITKFILHVDLMDCLVYQSKNKMKVQKYKKHNDRMPSRGYHEKRVHIRKVSHFGFFLCTISDKGLNTMKRRRELWQES